jgi:hypothetical protein
MGLYFVEGPTDQSYKHFADFNTLLASKSCENATNYQRNLFNENGHRPILGEECPINIRDCLDRVDSTKNSLEIACLALNVHPAARNGYCNCSLYNLKTG